jgi:hypothetical protein
LDGIFGSHKKSKMDIFGQKRTFPKPKDKIKFVRTNSMAPRTEVCRESGSENI